MSILKVSRMGHPVLRQKTRAVDKHEIRTPEFQKLIDDMIETMEEYSGIGLAAPQVHESRRLFVAVLDPEGRGEGEPVALINPEVTVLSSDLIEGWEGCLSIPDIRGLVPRSPHIRVSALTREAKRVEIEARDFPARVIQHETDHLDGVLFFDRMRSFESLAFLDEYSRYHVRHDDED
jgi:peptide deformylase